jgi:hypothetical protein
MFSPVTSSLPLLKRAPSTLLRREWTRCNDYGLEKCGFDQLEKLEPEKAYPSHVDDQCKT